MHYAVVDSARDRMYMFRTRWGARRFARRLEAASGRKAFVVRHAHRPSGPARVRH